MSSEMDGIVQDFLVESYENLDQLDQALVALEGDSDPQDRLASIFRAIHTIKGTCGFLGFSQLESLSHAGESLLSRLRDGALSPTPVITNALLQMLDSIREILASIESTGEEGNATYQALVETLDHLQNSQVDSAAAVESAISENDCDARSERPAEKSGTTDSSQCPGPKRSDAPERGPSGSSQAQPPATQLSDNAIRVDVKLLDKLMVLVGELVLVRNRMQQHATCLSNSPLVNSSQRLNLITTELQEAVMKARMQPIGSIWSKFPRVVRDLALACGKQVSLEMDGLETELDKTLIEAVKDPFTHLLRNAIDHGIETPEIRMARGKPIQGRIWLRAYHEGGQVNIDIADDGDGISPDRIKIKALERGLITQDQANAMSDREAIQLIFLPGFSTAEKITSVSGRGVGMDVVKANIERIGGAIDVSCHPGIGTTIRIKIPLTLAIIPALIIGRDEARFAIPQINLLELVRLSGDDTRTGIEWVHGTAVYRLRGKLLPLVSLNRELRLNTVTAPSQRDPESVNILVLQADDRRFGLLVDDVFDCAEIVVKPLDKRLHGTRAFAGATILGDGKMALILDIVNIAKSARILSDSQQRSSTDTAGSETRAERIAPERCGRSLTEPHTEPQPGTSQLTLLVFQTDGGRMAIPLSSVTRLEEIPISQIERTGKDWVVQYRGQILPLVDTSKVLGGPPLIDLTCNAADPTQNLSVVVCSGNNKPYGFVMQRILDIVEQNVEVCGKATRPGVEYTTVVQGRVTEIVEVANLLQMVATQQTDQLAT